MMLDLFSPFDPVDSTNTGVPSTSVFFSVVMILSFGVMGGFWVKDSPSSFWIEKRGFIVYGLLDALNKPGPRISRHQIVMIYLARMIIFSGLVSNILGVFNSFTSISYSFTLAFFVFGWGCFLISLLGVVSSASMLLPSGTPVLLVKFMTMVETVSISIRCLTLSIRLSANMIAGHVLTHLITAGLNQENNFTNPETLVYSAAIMLVENCVAVAQASVFAILSFLHVSSK